MTDTTQPEALRLADEFERPYWDDGTPHGQLVKAATELRRLHSENEQLRQQNTMLDGACAKLEAAQGTPSGDVRDAARLDWLLSNIPWGDLPCVFGESLRWEKWDTAAWRIAIDAALWDKP